MLFSATYDTEVMEFAEMMVPNAVIIKLRREEESLDNIKQFYVKCEDSDQKYKAMTNIYGYCTVGQLIIFCHVREF
jgi:ATP-dependent RNA helicase DDX19/DBP5